MSIFHRKNRRIKIPRSFYIKILVFCCLITASSIALMPIQSALVGAIANIRTNLIERLEAYTGMEIRYSSIRPIFFTSFDIRNLRIYKDDREIFTVSSVRIYFSLRELIFGRKTVVHTIQIERPVLRIDIEKDRDTFELLRSLSSSEGSDREILEQIAEFLPQKMDYRIRGGFFSISGSDMALKTENVNIEIKRDGSSVFFDTKLGSEFSYAQIFNRTIMLNGGIELNGVYTADTQDVKAQLLLSSLNCYEQNVRRRSSSFLRPVVTESRGQRRLFSLTPVKLDIAYNDRIVSILTPKENTDNDWFFRYDTQTSGIMAQANLRNFSPDSIISFYDNQYVSNLLGTSVTGKLSLNYEDSEFDYSIYLQSGNLIRYYQDNLILSDAFLIDAYGNKNTIVVNDLCLNTSLDTARAGFFQGILNYSGAIGLFPLRPSGIVSLEKVSRTGKESVNGTFNISSYENEINILSNNLSLGELFLKNLDANILSSGSQITVALTGLCKDDGAVYLDAFFNRNPNSLETSVIFDSFSTLNITEAFRPFVDFIKIPLQGYSYAANTLLDAQFFISYDFNNIVYNAPSIVIRNKSTLGQLSFSGTDQHFSLSEGIIFFGDNELLIYANADFSNPMNMDFKISANYLDISWNVTGELLDRSTLIARDPNGLHVYGNISRSGEISGYIEGQDFPVAANISPAYLDFYAALRYNSRDFWSVNVEHLKVRNLHSPNGVIDFSVSGVADQDGAGFRDIVYSDNIGFLAGSANFFWNRDFSFFHVLADITDGRENGEAFLLEGMLRDNQFVFNSSVSQLRVDRFIKGSGIMLANAQTSAVWESINSFNVDINLSSFQSRLQRNSIQASVNINLNNDEILIQNLDLDYSGMKVHMPVLMLDRLQGTAKAGAVIQGTGIGRKIEAELDLKANFNPLDSWIAINNALNSFDGSLNFNNIQYGTILEDNVYFVFSGTDGAISLSGGETEMIKLQMDKDGNFYLRLSDPVPIRGSFAGVYKNGNFDAYCNDYYIDLVSLWTLASNYNPNFNINGGYITGSMNLRGPVSNPEFYGTGRGTSLSFQVQEFISNDIKPVPFDIVAQGYEMTFGPVVAASGSGAGVVSGWFRYEYWVPRNIGLDISIARRTPIPYDLNVAGFLSSGDAAGRLNIAVNTSDSLLEIRGDLLMNNSEMGIHMEELFAMADEEDDEKYNILVDLSITTGSMVEFFWPNINSPVLRASPELGTVFRVSYDSWAEQYSLVSDIRIRSGEIYYLDRNFYIRQGNLIFRENERQFDPMMNVRAEIRERSDSGPVTISMIIENQPLLSFVPRFEATPSLTMLEIYTILGQNVNVQSNDADTVQRFLLTSSTDLVAQFGGGSDLLAQVIFLRQFERTVRNFLNLDMLSIRTRFFQNAVFTSGSALFGQMPVDRMNTVGNYFDNTTVFIGKYIGQDLFLQGTLTMKYDVNRNNSGGLAFEPDFGIEMQSPFLNIRWDFFPNHPQNWWVNDNSITLIWSKSF